MTWQNTLQSLLNTAFKSESILFSTCVKEFQECTISLGQWQKLYSVIPNDIPDSFPKRQSSFYYGRVCAEQALQSIQQSCQIKVGRLRNPIWPNAIKGSISHTHSLALAAVTSSSSVLGLGIDVEPILDDTTYNAIYMTVLNSTEQSKVEGWTISSGLSHQEVVTLIFSIKESFYKSVFERIQRILEFSAIEVIEISNNIVSFQIKEKGLFAFFSQHELLCGHYVLHKSHIISCVVLSTRP